MLSRRHAEPLGAFGEDVEPLEPRKDVRPREDACKVQVKIVLETMEK